jgi:hypothetical protein
MARLYDELVAYLAREKVSQADFCRFTGFPASTLNSMRHADAPKQSTIDRLMAALETWHGAAPVERDLRPRHYEQAPRITDNAWADDAAASSGRYLAALRGSRFKDGNGARTVIDLSRIVTPAQASREPCFHCGIRGEIGCDHRPAATEVL